MSIFSKNLLMLLCMLTAMTARYDSGSSFVYAQKQTPQEFRKIYVPEELPDSWPRGNWQPFSSKKYFQLLEQKRKSNKQLFQAGMVRAHYRATFRDDRLVAGKMTGHIDSSIQSASWKNLGPTNLQLQTLKWKQGKTNWGTNSTGDLFIHQQQKQTELEGEWSLSGSKVTQGTRFDFKLLRATQTTLQLTLPASVQLLLNERSQPPCFVKDISPQLREWTIYLSSKSELTILMTPVSNSVNKKFLLSRSIHLLTLGVSEQKFVSDFQVEIPDQTEAQLKLFLPEGFKTERIEISQENISTWKTIASNDEFSKGVIIPVEIQADAIHSPINIRVSGDLKQYKNRTISTTFPRMIDAVQVESQVAVVVESPLRTTNLSTTDLHQIDARIGPGIQDTWSFTTNGVNPTIDVSVDVPTPRLQVEQLVLCNKQQDRIHELKYFMFWQTNDEGLFNAKFRLFPGYEIREILVLSDANHEVPSSWNLRTEEDRKYLLLHLSNELVPGQKLAVSISLRPKSTGNQQTRISIPALQLVNGDLHKNRLLIIQGANLKQFPENAVLKTISLGQLKKWTSVWEELSVAFRETENQWLYKDISAASRIIIKPNIHPAIINDQQTILLPTEQVTASSPEWIMKQDFPLKKNWRCNVKVILHQDESKLPQVQIVYNKQAEQAQQFPGRLKFSEKITLHSVTVNGYFSSVESTGDDFSIPDAGEAIESLVVTYSTFSRDYLPLPAVPFPVACDQFLLCLAQGSSPAQNETVLFWQKLQGNYFAELEVDPAFAKIQFNRPSLQTSSTPFDLLLSEYTFRHGYNLYEAHLADQLSSEKVRLTIVPTSISWFSLFWVFLTILVLSLFFNILFQRAHLVWILLSVFICISSVFIDDRHLILILLPMAAALFLAAQFPGSFLKLLTHQQGTTEDGFPKRSGTLRHLLGGSYSLLMISFWLYSSVLFAQPIQGKAPAVQVQRPDLLIPVKTTLLTEKFQGLQPADYPDIIYLSDKVAREIEELESSSHELNEILFRSARYDVVWSEREAMQIHCLFHLIDTRSKQTNSFVLPLSGIDSLPALKATVNGYSASINPLPDGSGLEIPLPESKTSKGNRKEFREYLIELDVIPQNKVLENGIQFTLGIPPVAQCQMSFRYPEKYKARLFPSSQQIIGITPYRKSEHAFDVGAIKQLNLILDTAIESDQDGDHERFELFQTSMLAEISPYFLSLRLQIKVKFPKSKERTIKWKIPRQMAFRSVHALSQVEHRLESLTENQTLLVLKIPESKTNEETIIVDLIMPLDSQSSIKEISLPSLAGKVDEVEFEQQWQIALQTVPGYELSNIEFPAINTSRITASVFNQNWFGKNSISHNAACFRVEKPGRFKIKLQKQEKELTVIADHQFSAQLNQVRLSSQYQIDVIGVPLWAVTFENPTGWELDSVLMKSEETIIPVRVMKQKQTLSVAFAERMDDACLLEIHWEKSSGKKATPLKVTPPRIPQTIFYRETLQSKSNDPEAQWLIATEDDTGKTLSSDSSPFWKETLMIDADDLSEMPELIMQQSKESRLPQPPVKTQISIEKQEEKNHEKNLPVVNNKHLQVKMDHTVWQKKDHWIGETLIFVPLSGNENHTDQANELQVKLPPGTQILRLSHHAALSVKVVEDTLLVAPIKSKEKYYSYDGFSLMMIQWVRPREVSWQPFQTLPLPNSSQVASASWRLINPHPNKRALSQTIEAWKIYLLQLSDLGSEAVNLPVTTQEKSASLFQQILLQLPEKREGKVLSALQKLPGESWNQPLQLKMTSVADAGRSGSPLEHLVLSSGNYFIRYAILFIAIFWGWGMWRVNGSKHYRIRKRHLALGSFLLIGLLTTLVVY